jgi:acetylglutamate kinase
MKSNPIVVKIGGSTLGQNDTTAGDLVNLQKRGVPVVVVHGGAKDINRWLNDLKVEAKFVKGLRVTDADTLKVVTAVLCGLVNKEIVAGIIKMGGKAAGLSGVDGLMVNARNLNPELGFVGEEFSINTGLLTVLLDNGYMPVISPISCNMEKENSASDILNVNGDTVAAELASALGAEKLIFLTDVPGLYDESQNVIKQIKAAEAKKLIESNIITGGMSVKIKACIEALSKVPFTRILDGRVAHILIKEMDGAGEGTTIAA